MPDLKSQDLGNGYRLVFQAHQGTGGGMVRAVVKDAQGNITARGLVVPEADAEVSKRGALMEHMSMTMAPKHEPDFSDFSQDFPDDDDPLSCLDDEPDEDEDFS